MGCGFPKNWNSMMISVRFAVDDNDVVFVCGTVPLEQCTFFHALCQVTVLVGQILPKFEPHFIWESFYDRMPLFAEAPLPLKVVLQVCTHFCQLVSGWNPYDVVVVKNIIHHNHKRTFGPRKVCFILSTGAIFSSVCTYFSTHCVRWQ